MFCLSDVKVSELKYVISQNLLVVFRPNGTVVPHEKVVERGLDLL